MRLRYWVRRAVVSIPLWVWGTHETDTRRYDDGVRVFRNYEGMILWGIVIVLLWLVADQFVRDTRAHRNRGLSSRTASYRHTR